MQAGTHVRTSIVECLKESQRAVGAHPRDVTLETRGEEERSKHLLFAPKCFRMAGTKVHLFILREVPRARTASDFNREPIYRSDAFHEFFTMLNYAAQTVQWHNNKYDRNNRLALNATHVEFVTLHDLLMWIDLSVKIHTKVHKDLLDQI